MSLQEAEFNALIQILLDAGFDRGWAIRNDKLVVWEHEQDPPAPFVRPE